MDGQKAIRKPVTVPVRIFLIVAALILILWGGATIYLHEKPYYAISPGDAISVSRLISVPPSKSHQIKGKILLTDVLLGQVASAQLPADLLNKYVDLVPSQQVLGQSVTPSQLVQISTLQMSQSQDEAEIAALAHVGLSVPASSSGVLVLGLIKGLGKEPGLVPGDVISAVNGTSVNGPVELQDLIKVKKPGSVVALTVENGLEGVPKQIKATLVSGIVAGKPTTLIGIEVDPNPVQTYHLPFPISINSDQIGGPSAGAAFTLGIIDALSNGDITGGKVIAATGTIDASGNIGPIGGLPQKMVAVRRAGASIFFVPFGQSKSDYKSAVQFSEGKVRIVKVENIGQILNYLARMGGDMQGVEINPKSPSGALGSASSAA